ncbi:DUF2345 domain-containing protein, partial [Acinetobacter baumannii]
ATAVLVFAPEHTTPATAAKEIVLTAGGSQVKITGSGIFMTTSGKFEVKAGQHLFMGGGSVNANVPALPDLRIKTEHRTFEAIASSTID